MVAKYYTCDKCGNTNKRNIKNIINVLEKITCKSCGQVVEPHKLKSPMPTKGQPK